MRVGLRSLKRTYLSVDPRSLGVFRVGLALVLMVDLLHRYAELDFWYTNEGLLPNHTLLWRPPALHQFSFFFMASSGAEARLGFLVCGVCYLLFLVGYRTPLMQWLALICRISLNSRLSPLENGGDMVLNLLCVFGAFMPLGRALSLDAARRPRAREPVVSLAMGALLLQFSIVYLFNAASKSGDAWKAGDAVHYALHLDKYATPIGVWMRENLPLRAIHVLSWGTLVTEWTGCALIITPLFVNQARGLALLIMPLLHLSFALGLNIGVFSPAMIAFYPLLLTPAHWRALKRFSARWPRWVERRRRLADWIARLQPPAAAHTPSRWGRWAGEAAIAVLIFAIATEALNDNTSVPAWMRITQPTWAKAIIEYPRLLQGWRMFAPEPPRNDTMLYVDALTATGRHVDPYNEVAGRYAYPAGTVVPAQMDSSQFFTMYSDRIAMPQYVAYRQAFLEWLLLYPQRTGQPTDCLLHLEVYYVTDRSPAPGERAQPTAQERSRFMDFSAPADSPCKPVTRPPDPRARTLAALQ